MDAVVRLALENMGAPQRAYAIVRKTRSVESAGKLAQYCLKSRDFAVRLPGWGALVLQAAGWHGMISY